MKAATGLDEPARPLAAHAAADRERTGEDNYLLRRAALLHSDIAMMQPQGRVESFPPSDRSLGPQSWRIDIADGRSLEAGLTAVHWDIARLAVANVKPAGANRPEPQRDPMVRAWYTATAAWMQYREDHDTLHLDRARELFPGDAALLFLSGCQRESYAAPAIQAAARSVVLPTGITAGIESERNELRHAETFFRRALALQPDHAEAHLRLGRVLALLRRPAEAAPELNQALNLLDDDDLRYYAELFSGAVAEALGRFDAARDAYRRASELFPLAQSPYLGLSELAHRRGDRAAVAAAMQKVFDLPAPVVGARDDPWWRYHVAQARNADDLVNAVRAPFHRSEQ